MRSIMLSRPATLSLWQSLVLEIPAVHTYVDIRTCIPGTEAEKNPLAYVCCSYTTHSKWQYYCRFG